MVFVTSLVANMAWKHVQVAMVVMMEILVVVIVTVLVVFAMQDFVLLQLVTV